MSNETNTTIDEIMQAAYALSAADLAQANGEDDDAYACTNAEATLRDLIAAAIDSQARQIEALTAERDELRKRLDDAKPATTAPGEWVEWSGGECPIADGVRYALRFRNGNEAEPDWSASVWTWEWTVGLGGFDIVAYRIIP